MDYDRFNDCSNGDRSGRDSFEIYAAIDINRRAILDRDGNNLGDTWFTIDGKRYDEGSYYDMIDWVYDDDFEVRGINTEPLQRTLVLPYFPEPGQEIQICLNDDEGYKSCNIVTYDKDRSEKVSFSYPEE